MDGTNDLPERSYRCNTMAFTAGKREWVSLVDVVATRIVPLGFVFYLLATTVYLFYCGYPFGKTELLAHGLLTNVWLWLALIGMAVTWTWVTRANPRHTWMRGMINLSPFYGGRAAFMCTIFIFVALPYVIIGNVRLVQDLHEGPRAEKGIVCTQFREWPSYKNGEAKISFILRHPSGRDENLEFTSRLGMWDDGLGGSVKKLCASHKTFTLWRWQRTNVIADVE